jgi:hypothetical protein
MRSKHLCQYLDKGVEYVQPTPYTGKQVEPYVALLARVVQLWVEDLKGLHGPEKFFGPWYSPKEDAEAALEEIWRGGAENYLVPVVLSTARLTPREVLEGIARAGGYIE